MSVRQTADVLTFIKSVDGILNVGNNSQSTFPFHFVKEGKNAKIGINEFVLPLLAASFSTIMFPVRTHH